MSRTSSIISKQPSTLWAQFALLIIWGYQLDKLSDYFAPSINHSLIFTGIAIWFLLWSQLTKKTLKHPRPPAVVYSFQAFLLLKAQFCIIYLNHYHIWMMIACLASLAGITFSILTPWLLGQEHKSSPLSKVTQSVSPFFALLIGHLLSFSTSTATNYMLLAAPILITLFQYFNPEKPSRFHQASHIKTYYWANIVWFWLSTSGFLLVRIPTAPMYYGSCFLAGLVLAAWCTDWRYEQNWRTKSAGVWLLVQGMWFVFDTPKPQLYLYEGLNMLGFAFAACKLLIPSTSHLLHNRPVHFNLVNFSILLLAIASSAIIYPHKVLLGIVLVVILNINLFISTKEESLIINTLNGATRFLLHLIGVRYKGLEHLHHKPDQRVVIVANHVSLLDGPMINSYIGEKLIYPIYPLWLQYWFLRFLNGKTFHLYGMTPQDPSNLTEIIHAIRSGKKCIIFPEGRLTNSGNLMKTYEGAALIAEFSKADIQAVYLDGAMSLPSSRNDSRHKKRFFGRRTVTFMPCQPFTSTVLRNKAKRQHLNRQLFDRLCEARMHSQADHTLCEALQEASYRFGKNKIIISDHNFSCDMSYQQLIDKAKLIALRLQPQIKERQIIGLTVDHGSNTAALIFACWMLEIIVAPIPKHVDAVTLEAWIHQTHLSAVVIDTNNWHPETHAKHLETLGQHHIALLDCNSLFPSATYTEKLKLCLQPLKTSRRSAKQIPALLWLDPLTGKNTLLSQDNLYRQAQQLITCCDYQGLDTIFNPIPLQSTYSFLLGLLHPILSGNRLFLVTDTFQKKDLFDCFYETQASILIANAEIINATPPANSYDTQRMRVVLCADDVDEPTRTLWESNTKAYFFRVWTDPEQAGILAINTPYYNNAESMGQLLPTTCATSNNAFDLYTDLEGPIVPDFTYDSQSKTPHKNTLKHRALPFAVMVSPCGLLSAPNPILLDPKSTDTK